MACWHICRTFTGFEVRERKINHFGCESWGNLSSPTNPHYHYIMSTPIQRLDSFIKFY